MLRSILVLCCLSAAVLLGCSTRDYRDVLPSPELATTDAVISAARFEDAPLGRERSGHRLLDRWPAQRPEWVGTPPANPERLGLTGSLTFIGRAQEVGFVAGRHAAVMDADLSLARTINNLILRCQRYLVDDLDTVRADMDLTARMISVSLQSGAAPPAEFYEKWERPDGTVYWNWTVRSTIPVGELRRSIERTIDVLDWDLSEAARNGLSRCVVEGELW